MGVTAGEIILAYPERVTPVRSVRSTLLLAVRSSLQENGHYDAYCDAIPPVQRVLILQTVAGVWIPIEVAMVHYRALDTLSRSLGGCASRGRQRSRCSGRDLWT